MNKRDLSAKELVKLIKACRANGVSQLSFGDIRLEFGTKTMPSIEQPSTIQTKDVDQAKVEEIAIKDREKSELEIRQEQLEFMQLENPALFEQLLIERDLVNGSGKSAEN